MVFNIQKPKVCHQLEVIKNLNKVLLETNQNTYLIHLLAFLKCYLHAY